MQYLATQNKELLEKQRKHKMLQNTWRKFGNNNHNNKICTKVHSTVDPFFSLSSLSLSISLSLSCCELQLQTAVRIAGVLGGRPGKNRRVARRASGGAKKLLGH